MEINNEKHNNEELYFNCCILGNYCIKFFVFIFGLIVLISFNVNQDGDNRQVRRKVVENFKAEIGS